MSYLLLADAERVTLTQDVSWQIHASTVQDSSWIVLTSEEIDTSWRVLTSFDRDASWQILVELGVDVAWAIAFVASITLDVDTAWDIIAERLGESQKTVDARRRVLRVMATKRELLLLAATRTLLHDAGRR